MSPRPDLEQAPPTPPTPPTPPSPVVGGTAGQAAVAPSATEIAVATDRRTLLARRDELSRQLSSVEGRRSDLMAELQKAPSPVIREGIEARVRLLDARILEIETSIASNGRALAANPRSETSTSTGDSGPGFRVNDEAFVGGISVFSLFVLGPIAFAYARRIWRGDSGRQRRDPAVDLRLERIEQAVDAVAIEVERLGESQRYQAKLLGEGTPAFSLDQRRAPVAVPRDT